MKQILKVYMNPFRYGVSDHLLGMVGASKAPLAVLEPNR